MNDVEVTQRADGAYTAGPPPDGRSVDEHLRELAQPPAAIVPLDDVIYQHVTRAIDQLKNKAAAARALGISRRTLYRVLARQRIAPAPAVRGTSGR